MDRAAADDWIRAYVSPVGPIEIAHRRPWSTVLRVPLVDRVAWFKACAPLQAFEPRLTGELFTRWPDRMPEVIARDDRRAWILITDAGTPLRALGNPPEVWLNVLPMYAELQRGEAAHAKDHLAHGVPDLRVARWPARYVELVSYDLPLTTSEIHRLEQFAPRFSELCDELIAQNVPETIQHDDLHMANVYQEGGRLRVLDWGDSSISHPFASLVVTFRFLEEFNKLPPADPWYRRLRDAYLEPWGRAYSPAFALALRTGAFAHAFAWMRQRKILRDERPPEFDTIFGVILRRAIRQIAE